MTVNQLNNKCSDYRLIFDNVSLNAGDKVILENESFNITYNNIVILKGQIGSGKSTIVFINIFYISYQTFCVLFTDFFTNY